jgi:hypothetical protein
VARQVALFDTDAEIGFVYSAFDLVDETYTTFRRCQESHVDGVRAGFDEFARLLTLNTVPHSGTLVRRSCHEAIGYYDPRLPYAGDWDLWLRLAGRYKVGYLAQPLYAYRVHRNNMTSRGKKPGEHTRERMLALDNAFASLPVSAPPEVRALRPAAARTALLCGTWNDRSFGRVRRSWEGLLDAIHQSPSLLAVPDPYVAAAKLLLLTLVGYSRYERLAVWRSSN